MVNNGKKSTKTLIALSTTSHSIHSFVVYIGLLTLFCRCCEFVLPIFTIVTKNPTKLECKAIFFAFCTKLRLPIQNILGMQHFLLMQVKCPCPLDDILMKVFLQQVNQFPLLSSEKQFQQHYLLLHLFGSAITFNNRIQDNICTGSICSRRDINFFTINDGIMFLHISTDWLLISLSI